MSSDLPERSHLPDLTETDSILSDEDEWSDEDIDFDYLLMGYAETGDFDDE